MKVLICGDRNWTDRQAIELVLATFEPEATTVIEGEARGADRIAAEVAMDFGMEVKRYPALWKEYGRAAGPIRNQRMLTEGQPDVVYAFHKDLENSKGTKDMVTRSINAGVLTMLCKGTYDSDGFPELIELLPSGGFV